MRRFNSRALHDALDKKRIELNMSWSDVASEIGVSVSTIRRMQEGGRMEIDGMLAMVGWLGLAVESFVIELRE